MKEQNPLEDEPFNVVRLCVILVSLIITILLFSYLFSFGSNDQSNVTRPEENNYNSDQKNNGISGECDNEDPTCRCAQGEYRSCGSNKGICKEGLQECNSLGFWGECIGAILPEEEICGDGIDNDCDGSDLVCASSNSGGGSSGGSGSSSSSGGGNSNSNNSTNTTSSNSTSAECSDGIDNDGDFLVDYPSDPGCSSSSDTNETNVITSPGTCTEITWNGITWTFDANYPCGQFINDDWWVVGPVTITSISPLSTWSGERVMNGAMINPRARASLAQGYDSQVKFNPYNSELNVAFDVGIAGKTLVIQGGNSLVSSVSFATPQIRPQLSKTAILTILSSVPASGSFRPGYAGDDKTIKFNEANLDYSKLGNLAPVTGSPDFDDFLNNGFRFSWNDGVCLGGFQRYLEPGIGEGAYSFVGYGRDYGQLYGQATLLLNTDATNEEKRDLLIRAVQVGIDNMAWQNAGGKSVSVSGTTRNMWEPNGGNCHGRHWPILFAGIMLNDAEMRDISFDPQIITNPFPYSGQTFRVAETSPGVYVYNNANGYTSSMVGLAEWNSAYSLNIKRGQPGDATSPYWKSVPNSAVSTSNACWNLQYRSCCTGNSFWGQILSSYIMGEEGLWNDQTMLDYQDRYRAQTSLIFPNRAANVQAYRWRSDFGIDMWDQYRASYGNLYSGYPATPTGTLTCES